MHGIVMKITEKCIVVLSEDGRFHNMPHPSVMPGLGDKIPVVPSILQAERSKRKSWYLKKQWGIAASLLLLLSLVFIYKTLQGPNPQVTWVAIDINPSIELLVNKEGNVQKANLINDDARSLFTEKELQGQEFYQAVHMILSKAEEQGYLDLETEKKWIWVSVAEGITPFHVDLQKMIAADKDYNVQLLTANQKQLEKAKESGLTINKYVVYEQAKVKGVELNIEALRTHSIISSLTSAGIDPERLFDKNPEPLKTNTPPKNEGTRPEDEKHSPKPNKENQPKESNKKHTPSKEIEKPTKTKQSFETIPATNPVIEKLKSTKESENQKPKKESSSKKQELSDKVQEPSTTPKTEQSQNENEKKIDKESDIEKAKEKTKEKEK